MTEKQEVYEFWNKQSCGEELYLQSNELEGYREHSRLRYEFEPYILTFADFESGRRKRVLEIGVGLGADHQSFADHGAVLTGVDLTDRAISHTKKRFELFGLHSELCVADAESLPFAENSFDIVYSWGVLHHSPRTDIAIKEVYRVLKPGGEARIMIYNKFSVVGLMLWLRYGLLALKPWRSLDYVYDHYLESPGTKAYSYASARTLFESFSSVELDSVLTHGDVLTSAAGQRHRGALLSIAKAIWPRRAIRYFFPKAGLCLLVKAKK